MDIKVDQTDGVVILGLDGRLDVLTCKELGSKLTELIEGGATQIVLDMARLNYVSSAGLRVLLQARKTLKPAGGSIALCATNDFVKDIMQTTGFTSIFPFHSTVDEAVLEMKQSPS